MNINVATDCVTTLFSSCSSFSFPCCPVTCFVKRGFSMLSTHIKEKSRRIFGLTTKVTKKVSQ